jgi:hypothetical protein
LCGDEVVIGEGAVCGKVYEQGVGDGAKVHLYSIVYQINHLAHKLL